MHVYEYESIVVSIALSTKDILDDLHILNSTCITFMCLTEFINILKT